MGISGTGRDKINSESENAAAHQSFRRSYYGVSILEKLCKQWKQMS
jgi:hypothetical protein